MLVTLGVKGFNVTCQMTLSMKWHHELQVKNVFELLSMCNVVSVFTYSTNNICIGFTFLFLFCSTNTGIDQIINIIYTSSISSKTILGPWETIFVFYNLFIQCDINKMSGDVSMECWSCEMWTKDKLQISLIPEAD